MNILVTGGAGFIGSHVALHLASTGHHVRALDNFDPYYTPSIKHSNARLLGKNNILTHHLDLAIDPLEGVLEDIDLVIHLAAQPGNDASTPYGDYLKNNVYATVALLQSIQQINLTRKNHKPLSKKELNSKSITPSPASQPSHSHHNQGDIKLILASTSSIYGLHATQPEDALPAPASPYGVTKLSAEIAVQAAIRRHEIDAVILRFFSVYGPRERPDKLFPKLFAALKHDKEFPLFADAREHQRSFTYVSDIASGVENVINQWDKASGQVYNLGSLQLATTGEAICYAEEITGKKLRVKTLPPRPGDQLATAAQIDKIKANLGWQPQVSLKEGLNKVWQWAEKEL